MKPTNPFLSLDRHIMGDVYTTTEVMDNLTILCDDFGSRFGGTPGEKLAADFMKAKLEAYGLSNVHLEPIEYTGWRRGDVKLEILEPIQAVLPCITLPHSPPCELEGIIVDLGDGAPEDFDKRADEIKGNIVMTTSEVKPKGSTRWVHRMEKNGRAIIAGATGFIFVNHYPGFGPATGGIGHADGASLIPGISLAMEDGAFLQRLIKRNGRVKIRLTSTDQIEPMTSWNVVAELPGTKYPEQLVMLGCHYDGHDISQGAADPASGTVALIEAARVLAQYGADTPATIRFLLWGVEEIGLIGSTQYVEKHADELDNVRFYLNMDMAGAMANPGIVLNKWPDLETLLLEWSDEMALPFGIEQSINAHSDHYPFLIAGVPTGGIGSVGSKERSGRGYGHTRYDTLDKVDLRNLREASALAARLAYRMAMAENWPAARRSQEIVAELLDNPENKEEETFFAKLDEYYAQMR
ncbi:MAG: M20/M25/M40 family metallo-hydrolase [Anaerolineae bacterium]|nr:M20/M25/M40 family metallo-hydrolase [Anaerolineae bacterium]